MLEGIMYVNRSDGDNLYIRQLQIGSDELICTEGYRDKTSKGTVSNQLITNGTILMYKYTGALIGGKRVKDGIL